MPILGRRLTSKDSDKDIVDAIQTIAKNKDAHVLFDDHVAWLEVKLAEIKRLSAILKRRIAKSLSGVVRNRN